MLRRKQQRKKKAVEAKHAAEQALAEHQSKSAIDALKAKQKAMEEEADKTRERAKIREQEAKDQAKKTKAAEAGTGAQEGSKESNPILHFISAREALSYQLNPSRP